MVLGLRANHASPVAVRAESKLSRTYTNFMVCVHLICTSSATKVAKGIRYTIGNRNGALFIIENSRGTTLRILLHLARFTASYYMYESLLYQLKLQASFS